MNIPPEAIQAAHAALAPRWMTVANALSEDDDYPAMIEAMLTAALPHIRKQIAAEVRAIPAARHHGLTAGWDCISQEHAARIVEGAVP